ncbi:MAG: hypothetical protein KGL32_07485 [candidate division NC10 bacterium]|nr:hypothetical protein [candidate division NC10 bacterium]
MTIRRNVLAILIVAAFVPACALVSTPRPSELEAKTLPPKIQGPEQAPAAPSPVIATTLPPSQTALAEEGVKEEKGAKEKDAQESKAAKTLPMTESVPASPPLIEVKEGAPVSSTGPPGMPGPVQPGGSQYVSLNFDNADLELVLRSIADITGINFIIGPGVKANVTMRTTTRVPSTEVFSIMESVLEVNNLAAVKEGSYYKIVPIAVAQQEPQDVQVGKERVEERERYVTQIVHLDHLSADEMTKILQPFLARGAKMLVHKETNSLIIAGFSSTIKRLLDTVKALDIPSKRDNIQRIFVYFVENAKAAELANTLNTLYGRRDLVRGAAPGARPGQPPVSPAVGAPPTTTAPIPAAPGQPSPPSGAAPPQGTGAAPGEVVGEITIVSDEANNALIIKTSPRNYEIIEATIKQIDIVPKQVLIELLVAEITLTDTFNMSVEELIRTGNFAFSGLFGGAGPAAISAFLSPKTLVPPTGFTTTFVHGDNFRVVLNNLAKLTKVNILASPHLLTANNKEAKIQIGQEVPIITGEQSTSAFATQGTTTPFKTIQQKDIGIIMGIKPHVNEKRLVTLDIEAENTDVDQPEFGGTGSPSFLKRTTKTALVVQDGQSLVIGGIIQQTKTKTRSGVPFLSTIPLLGYLFSNTSEELRKTELVILITPHVIASPEEGQALTEQFRERVKSLESLMKSSLTTSPSGFKP